MAKLNDLTEAARDLSVEQLDALIHLAETMRAPLYIECAPAEAIAALEQGLAEIASGQSVHGPAVFDRLHAKLRSRGA